MTEVNETQLPGVGVRYEFTTRRGDRIGVLVHHGGRREVFSYDTDDPDAATRLLDLDSDDTRTLTELLGASHVSEVLGAVRQQVEGLALDWVELLPGSALVDHTIGDGKLRTRTGTSIVAVIRASETTAAPGPDFRLRVGDVLVAVGTPAGLETLRDTLRA